MSSNHPHARTERDLKWLAVNFSAQNIKRGIPERLEALAAWHRMVIESEKAVNGRLNDYEGANKAYGLALERLSAAGVDPAEGPHAFSPCLGPDRPWPQKISQIV